MQKERERERERERFTPKGIPIRLSDDFSAETFQAIKEWHDIFKVLKGKNLKSRILCAASNFLDKKKLRICHY